MLEDDEMNENQNLGMSESSHIKKKEINDLRKVFVKEYGVEIEFPGYYID